MDDTGIALVTGATRGIGLEVARALDRTGVHVLAGCRDVSHAAVGTPVRLDVTDGESVAAAAKSIGDAHGRLDILVNNAGILVGWGRPGDLTPDDMRRSFETNVFGVVAVTNAMLPLLRRGRDPRIVNVSSSMGSMTRIAAPDGGIPMMAYSASKAALNGLTVAYAADLRAAGIAVNSVDPGYCATDLNNHTGTRTAAEGAAVVVRLALMPAGGPTAGFHDDAGEVPW